MKGKLLFNRKGQGAVEFALSFVVFLAFMVILTDMVRVCYNWVCLQYSVNEGSRLGSVDSTVDIPTKVKSIASSLGLDSTKITITTSNASPGVLNELQAVDAVTLNPISGLIFKITGNYSGTYNVTATTIIRNELA